MSLTPWQDYTVQWHGYVGDVTHLGMYVLVTIGALLIFSTVIAAIATTFGSK